MMIVDPYRFGAPVGPVVTTWNPSDKDASIALSGGNLIASSTNGSAADRIVRAVGPKSSGKWVLPVQIGTVSGGFIDIGVSTSSQTTGTYLGFGPSYGYDKVDGNIYHLNAGAAYGAPYGNGDVIEILYDATAGELRFTRNGSVEAGGAAGASGLTGPYYAAVSLAKAGDVATILTTLSSYATANGYSLWD